MSSEGAKIDAAKPHNWIIWRDLMLALLKSQDLQRYSYEDEDVPEDEHENEAKEMCLIKKNISLKFTILPGT